MLKITITKSAHGQDLAKPFSVYISTKSTANENGLITTFTQSKFPDKEEHGIDYIGMNRSSIVDKANVLPTLDKMQSVGEAAVKKFLEGLNLPGVTSIETYTTN